MAIREVRPRAVTAEELEGTVWENIAALAGDGDRRNPFQVDSPTENENPQLTAGEKRVLTYKGSGQILLFNIDLPAGVTLSLALDGSVRRYSHGNESGVLRWSYGESPLRFTNSLEAVIHNTTASGQRYKLHVSGA